MQNTKKQEILLEITSAEYWTIYTQSNRRHKTSKMCFYRRKARIPLTGTCESCGTLNEVRTF